jgi:DNA repair protein RecN (Recombination protein N)
MLLSIEVRNFAIIDSLQLDWNEGMSVITGETGAGKSIVIDALGLVLGERAEQSVVRAGTAQAEVAAIFSIQIGGAAFNWLEKNDLLEDQTIEPNETECECLLRRVIVAKGRARAYINGRSVTQSQLKELARYLVDIHGQHAQQSLLQAKEQLNLLDRFANHDDLIDNVRLSYQQLSEVRKRKADLEHQQQQRDSKRELLTYQVQELRESNPEQSVLDTLESEHKQAASTQERLAIASAALESLSANESSACLAQLRNTISQLNQLVAIDPSISELSDTLADAESLLMDADAELTSYYQKVDNDPEALMRLDQQLSSFHDLARKHQVNLTELPEKFNQLEKDLEQLHSDDDALINVQQEYQASIDIYQKQTKLLSASRTKTAKVLSKLITDKIQPLAMEGGRFEIQLSTRETISASGMEDAEYLVSANPGQPMQPLSKVASGGELSRISLAISTITSEQQLVPCIIFDEVDVGIGGATAEMVGDLLKHLALGRQVLCVTHQPQVAACGHYHLVASKSKTSNSTTTQLTQLSDQQRVNELARMLGGKTISEKTLLHAKEMLNFE